MDATDTGTLITGAFTTFGTQALLVLTALVGIGIAFYVFRWGWNVVRRSDRAEEASEYLSMKRWDSLSASDKANYYGDYSFWRERDND